MPVARQTCAQAAAQWRGLGHTRQQQLRLILAVAAQVGMADIVWSDAQYTYNDGSEVSNALQGGCPAAVLHPFSTPGSTWSILQCAHSLLSLCAVCVHGPVHV